MESRNWLYTHRYLPGKQASAHKIFWIACIESLRLLSEHTGSNPLPFPDLEVVNYVTHLISNQSTCYPHHRCHRVKTDTNLMAEMNGRMNHPQCVPPPALCLQFPSLQACTEGLPLVLQRPDNFPLVMEILQEINQEKVGFSSSVGIEQRPLIVGEVKQESAEHHQSLNSDLCQEWSLKGVEELLTEPEELQLRRDCFQQLHEPGIVHLEACPSDEKPLIALQSVCPLYSRNGSKQAQLHFDEKPLIQSQMSKGQLLFQAKDLNVDEKSKTSPAARTQLHVNNKLCRTFPVPGQVRVEGLHNMQAVKREPEEVEAHALTFNEQVKFFEERKGSNNCLDVSQSVDGKESNRPSHCKKVILAEHKSQSKRAQSSEAEVDLQLKLEMEKKSHCVNNVPRNAGSVLSLPNDFSELERSHSEKGYSQISPSIPMSLAAVWPRCPSASSEQAQVLAGEKKPQSVTSVVKTDGCELTLGLASSEPKIAKLVKPFVGQEKHHGHCQRTSPHQWQQAKEKRVLRKYYMQDGQDTMPPCTQKQLFPATYECTGFCSKDADKGFEQMQSIGHRSIDAKKTVPQCKAGQLLSASSNCKTESNSFGDESGSRQTLQLMPRRNDEGESPLEGGEARELMSDDSQVTEPTSPMATESSQPPTAEVGPQLAEPQKKRMRGTLPLDVKGDVSSKDMDTRCHRSDGKRWRCVRECVNGAYYCQYHLRKRRIGYNRRKKNEVNPDDLEAVSKELLKPIKKSR